ncbi:MAG: carboxypeptidase, partial [Herpetosiphon sp.]|nr:carboxypeptidase [Herpetosiphon sp.]
MVTVDYTRYYGVDELVETLHALQTAYPQLMSLHSIGNSYEGRDLWLATLTNLNTGVPTDKPSFWIDGNIHATEVTGAMAALHVIDTLLKGYGHDDQCTRLLDTTTFYILPRFNPDGAERALTSPYMVRSSVRPYPHAERKDGLIEEDINSDGLIMQMRMVDVNGDWKLSSKDPRVMVKRQPDDVGGTYYRVLPEGSITNFDGVNIK